ncbi:ABC transporter permease [Microbacterium flavescens]|uniref:ABC transporter permease n=1 Tax=Microbacterium flavescens TaxID=69366 RepID=UPI001BDF2AD4|nr:ABC transporter permease [Microbacterium flavescens]BFF09610.1 ABC transporter permease [Microbacterium flavescens]
MTTSDVAASVEEPPPFLAKRRPKSGGTLGRFILIRFLLIIPTVFILVTVVFFLIRLTGDPITAALGGRLPADQLQERIHEAGFDRPVLVQYLEYLGQIATGNFGTTITDNQLITQVLVNYGVATFELVVYAMIVAFVIGIPLGMVAAAMRDRAPDAVLRVSAILFYATPVFFAGLVAKLIFSVWLGWFPVSGRASVRTELALTREDDSTGIYLIDAIRSGNPAYVQDVLQHAFLPAMVLGLVTAGVFLRLVRTNVIATHNMPYVDAARSRGVSEFRLVRKHAYKPALIPIVTVVGLQIALALGGAVLTETTFEWQGLGFQLVKYLLARDFVAIQGIVAMIAIIVALTNFVVDIVAAFLDPRVRY